MSRKRIFSIDGDLSGSLNSGEPEFLAVGQLRRPHGVKGEIRMSVWTDFPERLKVGMEVYIGRNQEPIRIRSTRWHGSDLLISFEEFTTREDVGIFRNEIVLVPADKLPPLPAGELYIHELIGMEVFDVETELSLGSVVEIIETGANDVFIVRNHQGGEILLPDIDEVILAIHPDKRQIQVRLLPGLVD